MFVQNQKLHTAAEIRLWSDRRLSDTCKWLSTFSMLCQHYTNNWVMPMELQPCEWWVQPALFIICQILSYFVLFFLDFVLISFFTCFNFLQLAKGTLWLPVWAQDAWHRLQNTTFFHSFELSRSHVSCFSTPGLCSTFQFSNLCATCKS